MSVSYDIDVDRRPTKMLSVAEIRTTETSPINVKRVKAARQLVLREAASLESKKITELRRGEVLVVVEEAVTEEGEHRARVARDSSPRGLAVHPIGWVTSFKDGEQKLIGLDDEELPPSSAPVRSREESMASRIAKRRQQTARERLRSHGLEPAADGEPTGGTPASSPERKASPSVPFVGSAQLLATAAQHEAEAEALAGTSVDTLATRVGRLLHARKIKVAELVKEWDRNGDGDISKPEFRLNLKKLGLEKEDGLEIDRLFDSLDGDKSGSIDIPELRAAFKKLQDDAKQAGGQEGRNTQKAAGLRAVAAAFRAAAAETEAWEEADKGLQALKGNPSVAARLGNLLTSRNIKVADAVRKWDTSGDGTIDSDEFCDNVVSLGLKDATKEELAALFVELDDDGSGELDLDETKRALNTLKDAATKAKANEAAVTREVAALKKAARAAQRLAHEAIEEANHAIEEAEAAAQQERMAAEAAEASKKAAAEEAEKVKQQQFAERQASRAPAFAPK